MLTPLGIAFDLVGIHAVAIFGVIGVVVFRAGALAERGADAQDVSTRLLQLLVGVNQFGALRRDAPP